MKRVITIDSAPKETGPEVIINPYKSVSQCPEIKECPPPPKSAFTAHLKKNQKSFLNFKDLLPARGEVKNLVDTDIFSELWDDEAFTGETNNVYLSHIKWYVNDWRGYFRTKSAQSKIGLKIELDNKSKDEDVYLNFHIGNVPDKDNENAVNIKETFLATHPISHGHTPGGHCRGLVLKSKRFLIHLFGIRKFNTKVAMLGKIYERISKKNYFLGNLFFTTKENSPFQGRHGKQ
ncbi:MAG: hypothetical protein ACPGJV_15920 [Bacteriovoracaceae bacterium]